jgi:ribosomal protein S18 acetylase RimI-like enzyme
MRHTPISAVGEGRRTYRLVPFGADAPAPVRDLSRLHGTLLPASPVALLGAPFMEWFYYRWLPADGLMVGAIAYVDGNPAGFVAATPDSAGFMRLAVRRRWLRLFAAMTLTVTLRPGAVRSLLAAARVLRERKPTMSAQSLGEILSMGVLEEYRTQRFVAESGLRLSLDLLDHAVRRLQAGGVGAIRAVVAADNPQAKLLYSGLGWTLNRTDVPEWRTPTVEFVWRA